MTTQIKHDVNHDKLSECPKCKCDACYILPINETKNSYFCWGCGFTSSDLLKINEYDSDAYEEILPELYKDVKYVDSENRVWYPITVNIESKGTVFLFGENKNSVKWAAIKSIELTEEEKQSGKYKAAKYKSDSKTLKYFDSDFIEALDYIQFFEVK